MYHKTLVFYGKVNIRAEVSLSFNVWKFLSLSYDHSNLTQFRVKVLKEEATEARPFTNLLLYLAKTKKPIMSIGVNGLGQILIASV